MQMHARPEPLNFQLVHDLPRMRLPKTPTQRMTKPN